MFANINNTQIFFDIFGENIAYSKEGATEKPMMMCIHGGPGGDHSVFKNYCKDLKDDVSMVLWDHRGSGRSARTDDSEYTLTQNVEDMEALRQYLGLEKVIVYGHSYGGMVAQAYALKYPEHIEKLILGVTVPDKSFFELAKQNLQQRGTPEQIAWGKVLFETGFKTDAEVTQFFIDMASMYSMKAKKEGVDVKALSSMRPSHECINKGFLGFLKEMNFTPDLPKIKIPTLVFAGRHDWICPPELSEKIAANIVNAQLKIFEQSGHSVPVDEPEAFAKMIHDFLKNESVKK